MSEQVDCKLNKAGGTLRLSISAGFLAAVFYRADYRTLRPDGTLSPWKLIGFYNGNVDNNEPLGPNRTFDVADCMLLNGGRVRIEYLIAKVDPDHAQQFQLRSTLSSSGAIENGEIRIAGAVDELLVPQIARFNLSWME